MDFYAADEFRDMPIQQLLDVSLPYAEVTDTGNVIISKLEGTGGELSYATCAQQLLYEVGDPSAYVTPDLVGVNTSLISRHIFIEYIVDVSLYRLLTLQMSHSKH